MLHLDKWMVHVGTWCLGYISINNVIAIKYKNECTKVQNHRYKDVTFNACTRA